MSLKIHMAIVKSNKENIMIDIRKKDNLIAAVVVASAVENQGNDHI